MMPDDTRKSKIELEVSQKGADDAARELEGIGKGASSLQKELAALSRSAQLDKIAREFGEIARQTDNTGEAVDELNKKLKELGANESEIKRAAGAFETERIRTFETPGGGAGGGNAPAAAKFRGAGGGNAPAAAKFRGAAGLIGGQGAANVIGVIDDVQDAFEGLSAAASAAPGALASAASALGPVGLGLAAVAAIAAAAFIAASQSIQAEADRITDVAKSRLSLAERLAQGLTTGEAEKELETNARRRVEIEKEVTRAQQEYNDFLAEQPDIVGGLGDNLLRVFDSREEAYAKAVSDAQAALKGIESDSQSLREAIDDGRTATEKAAQAEQKLADVRVTETKKSVDTIVKAEKDAGEARKKSEAETEKRREKAAESIKKHNDAVKSASDTFKDATADIGRKRREGEFDIRTDMGRDLDDIQLKNTQDITKAIKEDWRTARDEAFKNADEIASIRSEGRKAEKEALSSGNFKELFLAREATKERLAEEAKTDERERQLRELHLADVKDDLKTSLQQEQDARRTAGMRAFEDLKLSTSREMALAREARNSEYAQFAGHYNRMAGLQQQYINRVEQMLGGRMTGSRMSGERMTAQPRLTQFAQIIRKS